MKLKNKKKFYAMALAMVMSLSLTGCGEEHQVRLKENDKVASLLDGTILENSVVIEVGGEKLAVQCVTMGSDVQNIYHYHYCDVLTGYPYAIADECENDSIEKLEEIETEPIISYMTEDEIIKAMNGQLDDEDITNIISRINHSKVKTLS